MVARTLTLELSPGIKSGHDIIISGFVYLDEHSTSLGLKFQLHKWGFKAPFPKCQ